MPTCAHVTALVNYMTLVRLGPVQAHKRAEQAQQSGEQPPLTTKEGRRSRNRNTRVGHGATSHNWRAQQRLEKEAAQREAAQQASTYLNHAVSLVTEALQRAENVPGVLAGFRGQLVELGLESAQPDADAELQRQHAVWLQLKAQMEVDYKEAAEKQRAAVAAAKQVAAEKDAVDVELLQVDARRMTMQTRLRQLQQQQQQTAVLHEIEAERVRLAKGWALLNAGLILLQERERRVEAREQWVEAREQWVEAREQCLKVREQDIEEREQLLGARDQQFVEMCHQRSLELEHAWAELQRQAAA